MNLFKNFIPQSLIPYMRSFNRSLRLFISEYQLLKYLGGRSKFTSYHDVDVPVESDYFISSDRGVFALRKNRITKVFNLWTFGIAVAGSDIYLACYSGGGFSFILKGRLEAFLRENVPYHFREIYRIPIVSTNHRIHQICISDGFLWVANSGRNTLLQIDLHSGGIESEIAPFVDSFGKPILYDNNHINSISVYDDTILFIAYKAGGHSMIGVYRDGLVKGYSYKNIGVHDIHIADRDVFFSDTFGRNVQNEGGAVLVNGKPLDESYFCRPPGFIVRGLAGKGRQLVIGHSHKGERKQRFKGNASLLLAQNQNVTHHVSMPFAQFNDIIHVTGESFMQPPIDSSFTGICSIIESFMGPPTYIAEVGNLIHENR